MGFNRRIGILIGSLFVSVFLWSYVHLSQTYEADIDLPVTLNAPHGLALATGLPDRLHSRIRGAGWQILAMSFTKSSHFLLDLTDRDIKDPEHSPLVIHADDLAHAVILPSEVKLLKVEPDSLKLNFSSMIRKRVPIRAVIQVMPAPQYAIVDSPVVYPAYVFVEGAKAVLDSLTSFPTKPLVERGVREDIVKSVELSDTLQNEVSVSLSTPVQVRVHVEQLAERVFNNIPIEIEALPPEKEVFLIPGEVAVTLRGGVNQLANLNPAAIHAKVLYDAIRFDTATSINPRIEFPHGTTFLTCAPERVRFVVRTHSESHAAK